MKIQNLPNFCGKDKEVNLINVTGASGFVKMCVQNVDSIVKQYYMLRRIKLSVIRFCRMYIENSRWNDFETLEKNIFKITIEKVKNKDNNGT